MLTSHGISDKFCGQCHRTLECSGVSTSSGVVSRTLTLQVEDPIGKNACHMILFATQLCTLRIPFYDTNKKFTMTNYISHILFVEWYTMMCMNVHVYMYIDTSFAQIRLFVGRIISGCFIAI